MDQRSAVVVAGDVRVVDAERAVHRDAPGDGPGELPGVLEHVPERLAVHVLHHPGQPSSSVASPWTFTMCGCSSVTARRVSRCSCQKRSSSFGSSGGAQTSTTGRAEASRSSSPSIALERVPASSGPAVR